MDQPGSLDNFYAETPSFGSFGSIVDPSIYQPLPDDWWLGLSDVISSTAAIEAGRYKVVNTAGAAVITAVMNALPGLKFPFVFGGDGASFAVPQSHMPLARQALAATAAFVRDELELGLRVAMVSVAEARQAGFDVRVARYAASDNVSYAMFSGGGLGWAEREMKAGRRLIEAAATGVRPDLAGLSCRWGEIPAARGTILSLIVVPASVADEAAFREIGREIVALASSNAAAGTPVPESGPPMRWPPAGLDLEARTSRRPGQALWQSRLQVALRSLVGGFFIRSGVKAGGFDPARYIRETVENTDFRKYDDALRMTLDCTQELAAELEALLETASRRGSVHYGLHRQQSALITCVVHSALESDHLHFVDGAMGGYATAATKLKASMAAGR
jgi:hypothetical protein